MSTDSAIRDAAAAVDEVLVAIRSARRLVLTTHVNADGDGVGCESALLSLIRSGDGDARIVNPTPFPGSLSFLLPEPPSVLDAGTAEADEWCREADLCVVVDTGEVSRIGRVAALVRHLPIVVVDHHPPGDDPIEGLSFRDPTASAAAELVFELIDRAGEGWDQSVVDALYVAIMTDTGGFRFSNVTPRTLRIAADLVEHGASPDRLYQAVYGRMPLRRIRLLERVLPSVETNADGTVAWISIRSRTLRELGCTAEDLEGLVDYPRELEGVEVAMVFRELDDGQVKISFRSNGEVDVNRIAREFGGGGHVKASGALVPGRLEQVLERAVSHAAHATRDLEAVDGAAPVGPEP